MDMYIPSEIAQKLVTVPSGTVVLGTVSSDYDCATVSGLGDPRSVNQTLRRAVIGVVDALTDSPFIVRRQDGKLIVTTRSGVEACIHVFSEADYFKRTPFDPDIRTHLEKEKILIVGVGSVGAPMGLELAKAGIGGIVGVDKDRLEVHNAMRHVLGMPYIGWPKANAFAHYLGEHAPECSCVGIYDDVFGGSRARLRELIETHRPTRILAVTDSLRVQYILQMAALHHGIPLMAVWCDNNAVEGEVFLWEPGQAKAWKPGRPERGCYGCLRPPDRASIGRSNHFDYSSDDPDSYGGEPALGTFINRVNDIATIVMLAWILRDAPRPTRLATLMDEYYEGKGLQYIRLGGPYRMENSVTVTADHPWQVKWLRVLKQEACPYCGRNASLETTLYPSDGDMTAASLAETVFEGISGTGSSGEACQEVSA